MHGQHGGEDLVEVWGFVIHDASLVTAGLRRGLLGSAPEWAGSEGRCIDWVWS